MSLRKAQLVAPYAIALAGSAAILVATSRYGIGISAESETYIAAARNFAEGRGLVVTTAGGDLAPLTQHAPLYFAVLGLCGRFGADAVDAARWFNALLFGATALLAGLAVRAFSKRTWLPAIAASLVVSSVVILNLHLMALSESLFLFTTVSALVLLARHLQSADGRWLIGSAVACAAALLTRFAGVALVASGVLAIVWYDRSRRRAVRAFAFAALSCAPAVAWALWLTLRAGNPVHRVLAVHPLSLRDLEAAAQTLSTWILPGLVSAPVRFAVLAAVLLWLGGLPRERAPVACRVFLWFVAAYLLTIGFAKSFLDVAIPMDDRILSPIYIPAVICGALAVDSAASAARRRAVLMVPAAAVLVTVAGCNAGRELPCLASMYRGGREYTSAAWRQSSLADWLRSVDPGTPLYSNLDSAVRFLHPGVIRGLPSKADIRSGLPNPDYRRELRSFRASLESGHGVVVYFTDSPVSGVFVPTLPELTEQIRLTAVARGDSWIALRASNRPAQDPNQLPI